MRKRTTGKKPVQEPSIFGEDPLVEALRGEIRGVIERVLAALQYQQRELHPGVVGVAVLRGATFLWSAGRFFARPGFFSVEFSVRDDIPLAMRAEQDRTLHVGLNR